MVLRIMWLTYTRGLIWFSNCDRLSRLMIRSSLTYYCQLLITAFMCVTFHSWISTLMYRYWLIFQSICVLRFRSSWHIFYRCWGNSSIDSWRGHTATAVEYPWRRVTQTLLCVGYIIMYVIYDQSRGVALCHYIRWYRVWVGIKTAPLSHAVAMVTNSVAPRYAGEKSCVDCRSHTWNVGK